MTPNKQRQSQFSRQFARLFTSIASPRFRSSPAVLPAVWDGTDPRIGGHLAAPSGSHGGSA
jgi:hypothetical protein